MSHDDTDISCKGMAASLLGPIGYVSGVPSSTGSVYLLDDLNTAEVGTRATVKEPSPETPTSLRVYPKTIDRSKLRHADIAPPLEVMQELMNKKTRKIPPYLKVKKRT